MDSFTLFSCLVPEIRRHIWDAAVENAHNGPQVLHVRMVGTTTNKQGQRVADLKHTPDTITETQDARSLARACYEARHAVRRHLPNTLSLRRGELWFSDSKDVVTLVCDKFDGLGVLSGEALNCYITGVLFSLVNSPIPPLDLQVRRVGIDITGLCRYRASQANIQAMWLHRSDPKREQIAQQLRGVFLRDTHALLYLLKWLFPASGLYAVWEDEDVVDFYTNAEARVKLIEHQRSSNVRHALNVQSIPRLRQRFNLPKIPGYVDRASSVVAGLFNLKVGHVVYSNNGNGNDGGSGDRITEMSAPEAVGP